MFRKPHPESGPEPAAGSPAEPERPARRVTDVPANQLTTLGSLRIKGAISGGDSVDLAGALEGDVEVEGLVRVRETARLEGSIKADQIVIEGEVKGESLIARHKVELRSHARVRADIDAATVAVADGSFFQGRIQMREGGAGQLSFREKRRRPAGEDG
jgi:cytoskeletal protein CcmA (bactofilin family)